MLSERDLGNLLDILHSCRLIEDWTRGLTRQEFQKNQILQSAVLYEISVIGEAVRRLSEAFKSQNTEIEWVKIKDMRNWLIHKYDEINFDKVWEVISIKNAELIMFVEPLVPPPSDYEN